MRRITAIWVPESTNIVRQVRITRVTLIVFGLFLAYVLSVAGWFIRDYIKLRPRMTQFVQSKREKKQLQRQFIQLTEQIILMTEQLEKHQELDDQLSHLVDPDKDEEETSFQGVGGSGPNPFPPDYFIGDPQQQLARLMHLSLDQLAYKSSVAIIKRETLLRRLETQRRRLASTPSIWPVKGWLASGFGTRPSPFTQKKEFHNGIDISTRKKTPIIAPGDGLVLSIKRNHLAGRVMYIRHGYGLVTKFAHLEKVLVKPGQPVKRGQKIALVGNTGRSTGPHLHYEVQLNGAPVDPRDYIHN